MKLSNIFMSLGLSLLYALTLICSLCSPALAESDAFPEGKSCDGYLAAVSQPSLFFERAVLEPINVFSNPLELLGSQDSDLSFSYSNLKSIAFSDEPLGTLANNPSAPSKVGNGSAGHSPARRIRPEFRLPVFERRVFDLKYILVDSAESIANIVKNYRNLDKTPHGQELLKAKAILENNPEYSILMTDAGLSLWLKSDLTRWLQAYSTNALTPKRMDDFIFEAFMASDQPLLFSVSRLSRPMLERVVGDYNEVKSYEAINADDDSFNPELDEGYETDSITFFYRSLFRQALLEQRLFFLKKIKKQTALAQLEPQNLEMVLQNLAYFPEFLYFADDLAKTGFFIEDVLAEGGVAFSSKTHPMKSDQAYNVVAKVIRAVDDTKIETLNMTLHISKADSSQDFEGQDWSMMSVLLAEAWQKVVNKYMPNYTVKPGDFKFQLESEDNDEDSYVITVDISKTLAEQGLEPYLMYALFNEMF